jgi:organic radical activating enzyme
MPEATLQPSSLIRYRQADPLPVMEQFYTLQGEGAWSGAPAWFLRLAGCDVGCHWCDVKESWTPGAGQYLPVRELAARAAASGALRVVITGGEPSVYDLGPLTAALREAGLKVHIETAGPHPPSGQFDWVCLSPKKFLPAHEGWMALAHELKVIVFHESDASWAEAQAARCRPEALRFLQPEWSRRERILPFLIPYLQQHPQWRLSLQTHKYLGIP